MKYLDNIFNTNSKSIQHLLNRLLQKYITLNLMKKDLNWEYTGKARDDLVNPNK